MSTSRKIDLDEVRKAAELIHAPELPFELRVLDCKLLGEYRTGNFFGYYDLAHLDDLLADLERIESAAGVYWTPNPVKEAYLARAYNRMKLPGKKDNATADTDIERRRWLLIDVDPVRPTGVSSTAAERAAAERIVVDVDHWLWERGFAPGILADSGNGSHLMIPVDLPANDGGFCQRLLKQLDAEFSTAEAKIDTGVYNAARIWKVYGSWSCKGDDCPTIGREWRQAKITQVCREVARNG